MSQDVKRQGGLFHIDEILTPFIQRVKENEFYKEPKLNFLPREAYVEELLKVFYDLYYPTEQKMY